MKILNEEQFAEMMTDMSSLIGKIEDVEKSFDAKKMKDEIVNEIKKTLRKNSLFQTLENESLELNSNLIALKNIKQEFAECQKMREWKIIFAMLVSFVSGCTSIYLYSLSDLLL